MKIKDLITMLQKEDPERSIYHYEPGGKFPIDILLELEDGDLAIAQMEAVEDEA